MENQRLLVDKLREYESINKKIQFLNEEYIKKENEIKKAYQEKYEKINKDLKEYTEKILSGDVTLCQTLY